MQQSTSSRELDGSPGGRESSLGGVNCHSPVSLETSSASDQPKALQASACTVASELDPGTFTGFSSRDATSCSTAPYPSRPVSRLAKCFTVVFFATPALATDHRFTGLGDMRRMLLDDEAKLLVFADANFAREVPSSLRLWLLCVGARRRTKVACLPTRSSRSRAR